MVLVEKLGIAVVGGCGSGQFLNVLGLRLTLLVQFAAGLVLLEASYPFRHRPLETHQTIQRRQQELRRDNRKLRQELKSMQAQIEALRQAMLQPRTEAPAPAAAEPAAEPAPAAETAAKPAPRARRASAAKTK